MNNIYQIKVTFSPNGRVLFNNGGDNLNSDEYYTSMYVTANSMLRAQTKFKDYITLIAKSYKFTSRAKIVSGIDDSPMDGKIIRYRNEEYKLVEGAVVLGWLP
jgi:hypothetical protein